MNRSLFVSLTIFGAAAMLPAQDGFRPWGGAEYQQHQVRTALEAYRIDWNDYPMWTTYTYPGSPRSRTGPQEVPTFANAALTTPIAYLPRMPVDIFSHDERHWTAYCTAEQGDAMAFAIWSAGPDEDYDFPWQMELRPASGELEAQVRQFDYDATNGIISDGDLITVGR